MFDRFYRYSFVAAGSALSDWATFVVLTFFQVPPLFAQGSARIIGGIFSFLSNRHWSFSAAKTTSLTVQGRRFLLLYWVSFSLSLGLFYLLTEEFQLNIFLSKLLVDCICFLFNFFVMRFYVFHEKTGFIHWLKSTFQQS